MRPTEKTLSGKGDGSLFTPPCRYTAEVYPHRGISVQLNGTDMQQQQQRRRRRRLSGGRLPVLLLSSLSFSLLPLVS